MLLLVAMDANPASWLMTGHDEAKHLRRQAQVLMAKAFALNKSPTSKPPPVRCLAAARDGVFRGGLEEHRMHRLPTFPRAVVALHMANLARQLKSGQVRLMASP